MSATGSAGGFTLLELMVVMAILVMVAAVFPLALDRALPGHRVATTTQRLGSMLRAAQVSSLVSGKPVTLRIQGHRLAADSPVVADQSFPTSVAVRIADLDGQGLPALVVYPDGSALGARIEVSDAGHQGTIMVSALTGRLSLSTGH